MSTETKTPIDEVKVQYEQFAEDATRFWNRSTKPTEKEFMEQLKRTATAIGMFHFIS